MILLQGIPVQQGGTVSGVLRDSKGMPVAGVRMAAVARGEMSDASAASMAGIAETDAQGRFTLENIPPGRYAIAAGRLDLQTYYPGTQAFAEATVLTIASGSTTSGINFVLNESSLGRANTAGAYAAGAMIFSRIALMGNSTPVIPNSALIALGKSVEHGGKVPITANGREISVRLRSATDDLSFPINSAYVQVPLSRDFSVSVEGLPETHKVKSVALGGTDITNGTFRVSESSGTVSWTLRSASGNAMTVNIGTPPASAPSFTIAITLSPVSLTIERGVSVWGHVGFMDKPTLFISGMPGTLYADGSFEFRNVMPGRHLIAAAHKFTPKAAVVVVGDRDIFGIELKSTLAHPDISVPTTIPPAGPIAPGTVIPLPRIVGTVVDGETGMPLKEGGLVTVENEGYRRSFPLDAGGGFESLALFPGTYDVTLWFLNHISGRARVIVEDNDVPVKLTLETERE